MDENKPKEIIVATAKGNNILQDYINNVLLQTPDFYFEFKPHPTIRFSYNTKKSFMLEIAKKYIKKFTEELKEKKISFSVLKYKTYGDLNDRIKSMSNTVQHINTQKLTLACNFLHITEEKIKNIRYSDDNYIAFLPTPFTEKRLLNSPYRINKKNIMFFFLDFDFKSKKYAKDLIGFNLEKFNQFINDKRKQKLLSHIINSFPTLIQVTRSQCGFRIIIPLYVMSKEDYETTLNLFKDIIAPVLGSDTSVYDISRVFFPSTGTVFLTMPTENTDTFFDVLSNVPQFKDRKKVKKDFNEIIKCVKDFKLFIHEVINSLPKPPSPSSKNKKLIKTSESNKISKSYRNPPIKDKTLIKLKSNLSSKAILSSSSNSSIYSPSNKVNNIDHNIGLYNIIYTNNSPNKDSLSLSSYVSDNLIEGKKKELRYERIEIGIIDNIEELERVEEREFNNTQEVINWILNANNEDVILTYGVGLVGVRGFMNDLGSLIKEDGKIDSKDSYMYDSLEKNENHPSKYFRFSISSEEATKGDMYYYPNITYRIYLQSVNSIKRLPEWLQKKVRFSKRKQKYYLPTYYLPFVLAHSLRSYGYEVSDEFESKIAKVFGIIYFTPNIEALLSIKFIKMIQDAYNAFKNGEDGVYVSNYVSREYRNGVVERVFKEYMEFLKKYRKFFQRKKDGRKVKLCVTQHFVDVIDEVYNDGGITDITNIKYEDIADKDIVDVFAFFCSAFLREDLGEEVSIKIINDFIEEFTILKKVVLISKKLGINFIENVMYWYRVRKNKRVIRRLKYSYSRRLLYELDMCKTA